MRRDALRLLSLFCALVVVYDVRTPVWTGAPAGRSPPAPPSPRSPGTSQCPPIPSGRSRVVTTNKFPRIIYQSMAACVGTGTWVTWATRRWRARAWTASPPSRPSSPRQACSSQSGPILCCSVLHGQLCLHPQQSRPADRPTPSQVRENMYILCTALHPTAGPGCTPASSSPTRCWGCHSRRSPWQRC